MKKILKTLREELNMMSKILQKTISRT